MRRLDHRQLEKWAKEAFRKEFERCVVWNYIGGAKRIAHREPNADTRRYSRLCSWDYGTVANVSNATALRHLRALVRTGVLEESPRVSNVPTFLMNRAYHDEAGREIIASLAAQGIPFERA